MFIQITNLDGKRFVRRISDIESLDEGELMECGVVRLSSGLTFLVSVAEFERISAVLLGETPVQSPDMTPEQTEAQKWIDEVFPLPKPKTPVLVELKQADKPAQSLPEYLLEAYEAADKAFSWEDAGRVLFPAMKRFVTGEHIAIGPDGRISVTPKAEDN